jgi:hypothetical protein
MESSKCSFTLLTTSPGTFLNVNACVNLARCSEMVGMVISPFDEIYEWFDKPALSTVYSFDHSTS